MTAPKPLQLFDTLTKGRREFPPADSPARKNPDEPITYYTCGPTVYDHAHIGNFRAYIFEDQVVRALEYLGWKVKQVMNLTDVDDKTIKGANPEGAELPAAELRKRLDAYTQTYRDAFFADIDKLNIQHAAVYPRATETIGPMVGLVQRLIEKGYAYEGEDGHWYFPIRRFDNYGALSGLDLDDVRVGARVDSDEYDKQDARDFALWKAHRPGEPAWDPRDYVADSPLPVGRPGWHLECSAMSTEYLGRTIDLHSGGHDNIFPHHENEIAQSEAANGVRFVRHWLHCGYLLVENQKMSKSLGNFYTLRDLEEKGYEPLAVRLLLLGTHYRKPLNFTFAGLDAAAANLKRLREFLRRLERERETAPPTPVGEAGPGGSGVSAVLEAADTDFRAALADNLNISGALAAVYGMTSSINRMLDDGAVRREELDSVRETMLGFDRVLGLGLDGVGDSAEIDATWVEERLAARKRARAERDFAAADAIRDELAAAGVVIKDTPRGTTWHVE
jgi:cysteinyl-tRNA synthetase